ncbi:Miro domain protein [Pyrobaculum islandicum DSM 4184]|uniref:Miro domain protein n=1 Tax=Pyrobaculum islandicum (strain DSM 4184 / JCM 9189 / GEO3) TaxID=384616 RepID=A1RUX4_PYRIL|nr:GTPase domain-containing protein [Pyrobaculum islandicum]ABL88756.1 Miro domain protein [Pyrobaculum islandicum DSM 4184]
MRCLLAAVLGVGGVGKTTYIYRLIGVPVQPKTTLRPGIYRGVINSVVMCILDIPGDSATEIAEALAKAWPFYLDLAIFMYDVTDVSTLYALLDIEKHLTSRLVKPYRRSVVIGNKIDLVKIKGLIFKGDEVVKKLGACGVFYISALKDPYEKLVEPLKAAIESL